MRPTWGLLFSYESYEFESSSDYAITRFFNVVLLKNFHGLREGGKFIQAEFDIINGTICFALGRELGKIGKYTIEFNMS